MSSVRTTDKRPEFRPGDQVALAAGPYEGTPGVFLNLREDVNWADIEERNGIIRHHPVQWLQHSSVRPGIPLPNELSV